MAIDFYTGVPGSGKSYHAAQKIYNAIRSGKTVIGNIEINIDNIPPKNNKPKGQYIYINNSEWLNNSIQQYRLNTNGTYSSSFVEPKDIFSYLQGLKGFAYNFHARNKDGTFKLFQTLIILDECQELFNSRTWNRKDRLAWCAFFRLHRKLGYDCILISQDDKCIDKQIRAVLETEYIHRNVSKYKLFGKLLAAPFGGNLFLCVKRMYGYSKKDSKIGTNFIFGSNKYFKIYDTTQLY